MRKIKSIESAGSRKVKSKAKLNHDKVMKFARMLNKSEAKKISTIISKEFTKIEGEW